MKIVLVCLLILIGVGSWQGYNFYQSKVSADDTAIAGDVAQIQSLKDHAADLQASNTRLAGQLASVNKALDEMKAAAASQASLLPSSSALPSPSSKVFVAPSPLPSQPNWTWTTTDGKVFKNVVVTKIEADCATILDDDGGALVPIATLPPGIQKLCNYDPDLGARAYAERQQADKASAAALGQERALTAQINAQNQAAVEANEKLIDQQHQQQVAADAAAATAARVADPLGDAQAAKDDIGWARKHVSIDAKGVVSGDPYWVAKYNADLATESGK